MRRGQGGRRSLPDSGLAFLDVISCGFGAVILLLIITRTFAPMKLLDESAAELEQLLVTMQKELFANRRQTREIQQQLSDRQHLLAQLLNHMAVLEQRDRQTQSEFDTMQRQTRTQDAALARLASARQSLTEEMASLLGQDFQSKTPVVGGIPVDSEYIIFVIDSSPSMQQRAWRTVAERMEEALELYPEVKGIQVMNDNGIYMFPQYRGQWIPDTPQRREAILRALTGWSGSSNSSPVEGITEAIRTYWSPDRKISIYVLGDDFGTRDSIEAVINTVDRLNQADQDGHRRVRIHTIAFPVYMKEPRSHTPSANRFATLMRELARRNGGTFVGVEEAR